MSITDFNAPQFDFEIPEHFEFTKLADIDASGPHRVNILYINDNSDYGEAPVVVTDGAMVNLPAHLTGVVRKILADQNLVDQINSGVVGFTVREYQNKYGPQRTITWMDGLPERED